MHFSCNPYPPLVTGTPAGFVLLSVLSGEQISAQKKSQISAILPSLLALINRAAQCISYYYKKEISGENQNYFNCAFYNRCLRVKHNFQNS